MTFRAGYGKMKKSHLFRGQLKEIKAMERIKTLETRDLCASAANGGCGECQTSCQSACKTSCGVANQGCESLKK